MLHREHSRRFTPFVAVLAVTVALGLAGCSGDAAVQIASKISGEASSATEAANSVKSAIGTSDFATAESYAATADAKSQAALTDASSQTVTAQTKQTAVQARSEALAAETLVREQTVSVSDTAYNKAVRETAQQAVCTVVDNALSGQQQPDPQQWAQAVDNTVRSNPQTVAGSVVPPDVINQAAAAVDQTIAPWIQKYADLTNFDPGNLQSWLQTTKAFLNC